MRLLSDRVLVESISEEKKVGNIYIPPSSKDKVSKGVVLGIGVKCKDPKFKIGDIVIYGKFSGTKLSVDEKPCVMLRVTELGAVVL